MSQVNTSFSFNGYHEYLNIHKESFNKELDELFSKSLPQRIWSKDYILWQDKPDEISNRLGWLDSPVSMEVVAEYINEFPAELSKNGLNNTLLVGMGGSSLAPEFFEKTFSGNFPLKVIDTTDPESIAYIKNSIDPKTTLIIVSTKSGTTVETISLMNYFYNEFYKVLGGERVGSHFAAITDPGSNLENTAKKLNFRKIFLNDPDIGGRYSALSHFGLVPASLLGVDIKKILRSAKNSAELSGINDTNKNIPLRFGTLIGYCAGRKIDKLTIITSKNIKYFSYWVEQLIAESTGKNGVGVLPVIEDKFDDNKEYSSDRLFVFIKLGDDEEVEKQLISAVNKNHPLVCMELNDLFELGGLFFNWEFATAVCGIQMGINPFDQPDVESSKIYTKKFIEDYQKNRLLNDLKPSFDYNGIEFFAGTDLKDIESLSQWLSQNIEEGGYFCIQAFITQTVENEKLLLNLAENLSFKFNVPVTSGFGPRYLHSTGQLHKGDSGKGVFIQFVSNIKSDIPIPEDPLSDKSSISFGVLKNAQSLGDYKALKDRMRNILRINLGNDVEKNLNLFSGLI
ncbi:MAG: hypothetical protein ACR2NW_05565 [Thermodesulfobacteriota bacterium]